MLLACPVFILSPGTISSMILRTVMFLVIVFTLVLISMKKSPVLFLSTLIIIFSSCSVMVLTRPKNVRASQTPQTKIVVFDTIQPGFIVHPATSVLAEQLTIDPQALSNENYSGIYDESGDYVPQYCDDPEKVPQGAMPANLDTPPAPPADSVTPPAPPADPVTPPAE